MIRIVLLILFSFMMGFSILGQNNFLDSIKYSLKQKPVLTANYGTRNSFISNRRAQMTGYTLGLSFNNNFDLGIGYHELTSDFYQIGSLNKMYTSPKYLASLHLQYLALYAEYTFYQSRYWSFGIPVQIGFGRANYEFPFPGNSNATKIDIDYLIIYEPTMKFTYNVTNWFGVGGDLGYRILVKGSKNLNQKFNSPIYALGLRIYYWKLFKKLMAF